MSSGKRRKEGIADWELFALAAVLWLVIWGVVCVKILFF
jgi:hypothetical protein